MKFYVKTYYLDRDAPRVGDQDPGDEPTATQQNYEAECNINNIMKRYLNTGILPEGSPRAAAYGDFCDVGSYQEALSIIANAQDQFDALPSAARARFDNDPAAFLEFIQNPANLTEAQTLGLLKEVPPPETPPVTQPAPPTATPAAK